MSSQYPASGPHPGLDDQCAYCHILFREDKAVLFSLLFPRLRNGCSLSGVSIKIFCEKEIAVPCYRKLSLLCEVHYVALRRVTLAIELNFRRRIKSRLPFADIIGSSPYSSRFQGKG